MERIVHLDLKGAPLKVSYLEKVLMKMKSWGATGILLEWEDTFPFTGDLLEIGSLGGCNGEEMYTMKDVTYIMDFIREIGLEPIQLVQTISHLEYVLKHRMFSSLREAPRSPAVLCPSRPESVALVKAMLCQILESQPGANYIHIGADEVWHAGVCQECQRRAQVSEHKTAALYLDHITDIAKFVKQMRPNITIMMWDDMLRGITIDTLRVYRLGELVQPVVWHYNPKECFQIDPRVWANYKQLFPKVWAGSAYKGANGSCQLLSPVNRYVSNHEAWMQVIKELSGDLNFSGIILTGWSRYDHYATLCELLPVSLPSLASCLKLLTKTDDIPRECVVSEQLASNDWPGEELARCIHSLVILRERCFGFLNGDLVTTWLNPWQIEKTYTNPIQVESIAVACQHLLSEYTTIKDDITVYLHAITGQRSLQEFLKTFVLPIFNKMTELRAVAQARYTAEPSVNPD